MISLTQINNLIMNRGRSLQNIHMICHITMRFAFIDIWLEILMCLPYQIVSTTKVIIITNDNSLIKLCMTKEKHAH